MSEIIPVRKTFRLERRYSELVVPPTTAAATLEWGPYASGIGPGSVSEFIDTYILPDFNVCQAPVGALQRQSSYTGGRAVYVVLTSESIVASAPSYVTALATSCATASKDSFAIHADPKGDCWVLAKRTSGLRHGCLYFLRLLGVRYLGSHTSWTVRPNRGVVVSQAIAEVFTPEIGVYAPAAIGAIGTHGPSFPGAVADSVSGYIKSMITGFMKQRNPWEAGIIGGDGGENVIYFKQHEYRQGDKSMLAWTPTGGGIRGQSDPSSGTAPFPDMCFSASASIVSKFCVTHHGTAGAGSYPTAPTGATPWIGIPASPLAPLCTVGVNDPPGSPVTQTGINPSAGDYASFDGGVKLFCEFTRDAACQQVNSTSDPLAFNNFLVGTSPADGAFECRCDMCWGTTVGAVAPRLRSGGLAERKYGLNVDTTDSDLVAEMGNIAQDFLQYWFQNSTTIKPCAGWTAYADHAGVPNIPLAPGQFVALLPQTTGSTNLSPGEVIDGWVKKSATNPRGPMRLGLQYTWCTTSNFDVPNLSPRDSGGQTKKVISQGIRAGLFNQTTNSHLAVGCINYVEGELAWDSSADIEELIAEWMQPLGAAATAVRGMFERWWNWFELAGHEIGQMCLDLQAAQTALTADAGHTSAQQDCLDHIKCGVHWLRLLYEWQNALRAYQLAVNSTTLANLLATADAALQWAWSVVPTLIINSDTQALNIYNLLPSSGTGAAAMRAKWDKTDSGAAGWATVSLPTTSALTALIAADLAAYPRISGVTRKTFNFLMYPIRSAAEPIFQGTLVPINQAGASGGVLVNTIRLAVYYQTFRFRKGAGDIVFHLQQAQLGAGLATLATRIRVLDGNANQLMVFEATATNPSAFVDHTFTITGIPQGDYTLEFNDALPCNANQYLQWPQNVTLTQVNLYHSSQFQQSVRVYFYVPAGETKILMSALTAESVQFYNPGGAAVTTTQPYPRNFVADCTGLSGQIWSFDHSEGVNPNNYIHFENCPDLFAFDPLQLMVPAGLDGHS